jgi:thioredoxin 1
MLAPVLSQLALEFEGKIQFARVDVDEAPGIGAAYNITSVPTLMLFLEGRKVKQVVGLVPAKALRSLLQEVTPADATAVGSDAR